MVAINKIKKQMAVQTGSKRSATRLMRRGYPSTRIGVGWSLSMGD